MDSVSYTINIAWACIAKRLSPFVFLVVFWGTLSLRGYAQDGAIYFQGDIHPTTLRPIAPVQVNGVLLSCLLDTGAGHTVIDDTFSHIVCKDLKEGPAIFYGKAKTLSEGKSPVFDLTSSFLSGSKTSYKSYANVPITIGEKKFVPELIGTWPANMFYGDHTVQLNAISADFKYGAAGIIGIDILSQQCFELNFSQGKFCLREDVPERYLKGAKLPLSYVNEYVFIQINIRGQSERVLLDTGHSGGLMITEQILKRLTKGSGLAPEKHLAAYLNGGRAGVGSSFVSADVGFADGMEKSIKVECQDDMAILGIGGMRYLDWCIDFPNKHAYIVPSASYNLEDTANSFGMTLITAKGTVGVLAVAVPSVAKEAGVLPYDEICALKIGDNEYTDYQTFPHLLKHAPSGSIKLTVLRAGKKTELVLRE